MRDVVCVIPTSRTSVFNQLEARDDAVVAALGSPAMFVGHDSEGKGVIHYIPGDQGYILHERSQHFHAEGTGLLSIKTFFHGSAFYRVGRRRFEVNNASYFILNSGQTYTIDIDADRPVESFCLFFAPGFADATRHSLLASTDRLLLEPTPPSAS